MPRAIPASTSLCHRFRPAVLTAALVLWPSDARQLVSEPLAPAVAAALDSVFVVAIGETHGHVELHDTLRALLADPRILSRVDDIVVEFGNALYQPVIDRYVRGEAVPYDSVRLAWRNTMSSPSTVWDSPIYERFYQHVRFVNETRTDGRRYRLVLGDSPVDWSRVASFDDLRPFFNRSEHMTGVVEREVLAEGRRAVLIAGGAHLTRATMVRTRATGVRVAEVTVAARLALRFPGSLFVIRSLGRTRRFDFARARDLPRGSLLRPAGTWLASLSANDVTTMRNSDGSPFTLYGHATLADLADAVIYWGPEADNHFADPVSVTYREEVYWAELNRRSQITRRRPMDPALRR